MVSLDPTIFWVVTGCVLALAAYVVYLEFRKPKLVETLPIARSRPLVVTERGLRTIKEHIQLGGGKYRIVYAEADGYQRDYYADAQFDELIPIYKHQTITGTSAPLFIEFGVLLEAAYKYEDAPTRKLLKVKLAEVAKAIEKKGMSEKQAGKLIKDFIKASEQLGEPPALYKEVTKALGKKADEATRNESQLAAAQAGIEGNISRRTAAVERIAASKAGRNDDRNRNQ